MTFSSNNRTYFFITFQMMEKYDGNGSETQIKHQNRSRYLFPSTSKRKVRNCEHQCAGEIELNISTDSIHVMRTICAHQIKFRSLYADKQIHFFAQCSVQIRE